MRTRTEPRTCGPDILDRAALRAMTLGDDALARQLLGMWTSHGPVLLAKLRVDAPPAAWRAALHDLRSAAGTVCAPEVVRLCHAGERVADLPGARPCVLAELRAAVAASARAADAPHPKAPGVPRALGVPGIPDAATRRWRRARLDARRA